MPAGDAQRTWFPEMLDALRADWRVDMPFEELIPLAGKLDTMLHRIRPERQIRNPMIRCPRCGHVGPVTEPGVSVRATILALGRFGIAPLEHVKVLDRSWAAYRKLHGLDLYGKRTDQGQPVPAKCGHIGGA